MSPEDQSVVSPDKSATGDKWHLDEVVITIAGKRH